jgi:hypothetical protein
MGRTGHHRAGIFDDDSVSAEVNRILEISKKNCKLALFVRNADISSAKKRCYRNT